MFNVYIFIKCSVIKWNYNVFVELLFLYFDLIFEYIVYNKIFFDVILDW